MACIFQIKTASFFEPISKRRKGFPSEARVKRGVQIVHGNKQLVGKLGRNDPMSTRFNAKIQELLHEEGCF